MHRKSVPLMPRKCNCNRRVACCLMISALLLLRHACTYVLHLNIFWRRLENWPMHCSPLLPECAAQPRTRVVFGGPPPWLRHIAGADAIPEGQGLHQQLFGAADAAVAGNQASLQGSNSHVQQQPAESSRQQFLLNRYVSAGMDEVAA